MEEHQDEMRGARITHFIGGMIAGFLVFYVWARVWPLFDGPLQ
jgi:hypothetical protein